MAVDTRELEPMPDRAPSRWHRLARLRAGVLELLLVTALYIAYDSSRLLASDDAAAAKHRAMQLLRIEQATGLDIERAINGFFVRHDVVGLLGCYWYATAHYVLTVVVLVWLYLKGRHAYVPARRALMVGTILALALYLMLPTAPPRFFPDLGYVDVLQIHSDRGWWGADASAPRGMGQLTNQLAAFPSLHCGWALWVALCVHRNARSWVLRILAWLSAAATAVAVIGTGNHWTLDVIVGWMVIIAGVVGVASFTKPPRSAEAPDPQESS